MSLRRCFFLFRQRISPFCPFSSKAAAKTEQDYPEILPTRKWGTARDIPGVAVMSYRREELKTNDPWNIKPSRRKPTLRDYFFFPSHRRERAVRSYQTPSPREYGGSPFSCLIYSDKSFRRNGYNRARRRPYERENSLCTWSIRGYLSSALKY